MGRLLSSFAVGALDQAPENHVGTGAGEQSQRVIAKLILESLRKSRTSRTIISMSDNR
jgi:hypothetical protein